MLRGVRNSFFQIRMNILASHKIQNAGPIRGEKRLSVKLT